MTKMHENELEIDISFARKLIETQCPQWNRLPIVPVQSSGTDNALFRLGNEYIIRLPRIEWESGSVNKSINKEYEWLPKLAKFLKIPISEPIFKGHADNSYPWPWLVSKWNEGQNPDFEKDNEYELLAKDLAYFLNELHNITLPNGISSRRGIPLNTEIMDEETKKAISELKGVIDTRKITLLWEQLSNIPNWEKEPLWVHGDFLPGNILIQNNRLSAVLDFTDVGIGDPACDLVIAWSLFNQNSRFIFRQALENIDDHTWERGKGWALSIALIILPYYMHTNPVLVKLAKRMLEQILLDSSPIQIRKLNISDLDDCISLFRNTVHAINIQDYNQSQLDIWAPSNIDKKIWWKSLSKNISYVAVYNEQIIGFGDMSYDGYFDRLYVHKNFQRRGIASALINKIEEQAKLAGIREIHTEASITAKPLMEAFGYQLITQQIKEYKGEKFVNFIMKKILL